MLNGDEGAQGKLPCQPHKRYLGTSLAVIGMVLALVGPGNVRAASIQGASGADGNNLYGAGGAGAGNTGSGGTAATPGFFTTAPQAGVAGTNGTGGGGGGGGGDYPNTNGGAGGNGEFGTGGAGGTVTAPAGGGGQEAGGGGGFGASGSQSGGGGGGGGGGRGLTISLDSASIDGADSVTGGAGGAGGNGGGNTYADGGGGGGGGIGVLFGGTGVLTVDGSVTGGEGGAGGDGDPGPGAVSGNQVIGSFGGSGGAGGTGLLVANADTTITINGTVTGGDGGASGEGQNRPVRSIGGAGGAGVVGSGIDVVLGADGVISGGLGGDGTTRANAITFGAGGGANSFELAADSATVVGKVVANGTEDVFRLGGTTDGNSFDTTLLGSQYSGFESYEKIGTGTWNLTGAPGVSTAWAVKEGTLALAETMATDIVTSGSGRFALQGGTLDGALDNGGVTTAEGEVTGPISNTATGIFTLVGDLEAGGLITNEGVFNAFGSGSVGSFAVTGGAGFSNDGQISLRGGDDRAGDVLDLTGAGVFTGGAGSSAALDIDLSGNGAVISDTLLLGDTTGTLQVNFNSDLANYGALTTGVLVLQTADGNLVATATGLQDRGLVDYSFEQIGTDWYVTSRLNAAPLGSLVAGMQTVAGPTDALSQPGRLGSAQDPDGSCAPGIRSQVDGGSFSTRATTSGAGVSSDSDVDGTYGGAQLDMGFGCLVLDQTEATVRLGMLGGLNRGSSSNEQALAGGTALRSEMEFETGYAALYAHVVSGGLTATGQLGYDSTSFDLSAAVDGGTGAVIAGQQNKMQRWTANGTVAYAVAIDGVTVTPIAGLTLSKARTSAVQMVDLGGRLDFADHQTLTASGGVEVSAQVALAGGQGALRFFGSAMLYRVFGGAQAFTYSDDINDPVALETTAATGRGTLSAGISYEGSGPSGKNGVSLGVRGDLSYANGLTGSGLSLKAAVSF